MAVFADRRPGNNKS